MEMKSLMEQKVPGISKFPGKKDNLQRLSKIFVTNFRKLPFHLILYRNFRKFWLNGSRLKNEIETFLFAIFTNTFQNLLRSVETSKYKNVQQDSFRPLMIYYDFIQGFR